MALLEKRLHVANNGCRVVMRWQDVMSCHEVPELGGALAIRFKHTNTIPKRHTGAEIQVFECPFCLQRVNLHNSPPLHPEVHIPGYSLSKHCQPGKGQCQRLRKAWIQFTWVDPANCPSTFTHTEREWLLSKLEEAAASEAAPQPCTLDLNYDSSDNEPGAL